MKKSTSQSHAGSTFVVALLVIFLLGVAVASVVGYTSTTGRNALRSRNFISAQNVAEGGLEVLFAHWRTAGKAARQSNAGLPLATTMATFTGTSNAPRPDGTVAYPDFAGFTFDDYSISAVDRYGDPVAGNPPGFTAPLAGMPGWTARTYNYLARSTARTHALGGDTRATVERRFQKADAPIFQAAIFYETDLEIHPGADWQVTGLVHTNARLWACAGPPNDGHNMSFLRNVSHTLGYSEAFAPGDNRTAVNNPIYPNGRDSQLNQVSRLDPIGSDPASIFNTTDGNTNNDSFRELIERPTATIPPGPAQTDPPEIADLRFYNQAGLRILIDGTLPVSNADRVTIINGNGVTLTPADGTAVTEYINAVKAALNTTSSFQDNREGATMRVTNFDLSQMPTVISKANALTGAGAAQNTFNKIVYITDTSADPTGVATNKKAIRLRNGANIPQDLTIASENPVYIQGDFNTGGPTDQVRSNATNASSPLSAFENPDKLGYTRKSCAVLADAVSILSNNWSDANSTSGIGDRVATNTTVNTAILSGTLPTMTNPPEGQNYSGGAENFPRLLENWGSGDKNFTYYGSMVSLFESKQGKGRWGKGNVYSFPKRRWFFDTKFILNPPPGTVGSMSYSRGRWMGK